MHSSFVGGSIGLVQLVTLGVLRGLIHFVLKGVSAYSVRLRAKGVYTPLLHSPTLGGFDRIDALIRYEWLRGYRCTMRQWGS